MDEKVLMTKKVTDTQNNCMHDSCTGIKSTLTCTFKSCKAGMYLCNAAEAQTNIIHKAFDTAHAQRRPEQTPNENHTMYFIYRI